MTGLMAGSEQARVLPFYKRAARTGHLTSSPWDSTAITKCKGGCGELSRGVIQRGVGETFTEGGRAEEGMNKDSNYSSVFGMFIVFVTVNPPKGKILSRVCPSAFWELNH